MSQPTQSLADQLGVTLEDLQAWHRSKQSADAHGGGRGWGRTIPVPGVANMTFCVTGSLSMGTRRFVHKRIVQAGGCTHGTVVAHTDYLVTGERPGQSKVRAAGRHRVRLISEQEFIDLLRGK